ncbi:hypothetical protein MNJPNG_08175 [Cupriavidus oxalaticus]
MPGMSDMPGSTACFYLRMPDARARLLTVSGLFQSGTLA